MPEPQQGQDTAKNPENPETPETPETPENTEIRRRLAADPPGSGRERVQTGVRMEKRLVKVLKALAELHDLTLGDLLEGIVLHAFAGRIPFSAAALRRIAELERIYGLETCSGAARRPLPALGQECAP